MGQFKELASVLGLIFCQTLEIWRVKVLYYLRKKKNLFKYLLVKNTLVFYDPKSKNPIILIQMTVQTRIIKCLCDDGFGLVTIEAEKSVVCPDLFLGGFCVDDELMKKKINYFRNNISKMFGNGTDGRKENDITKKNSKKKTSSQISLSSVFVESKRRNSTWGKSSKHAQINVQTLDLHVENVIKNLMLEDFLNVWIVMHHYIRNEEEKLENLIHQNTGEKVSVLRMKFKAMY